MLVSSIKALSNHECYGMLKSIIAGAILYSGCHCVFVLMNQHNDKVVHHFSLFFSYKMLVRNAGLIRHKNKGARGGKGWETLFNNNNSLKPNFALDRPNKF